MLLAILLNPPAETSGVRTRNAVALAAQVLGHEEVEIANLYAYPTATVLDLNPSCTQGWLDARNQIGCHLLTATAVLAAWGISGLTGVARLRLQAQIHWLHNQMIYQGLNSVWTVGGLPRHPSRWHQYASNKYGRTNGTTPVERLSDVLTPVPMRVLL